MDEQTIIEPIEQADEPTELEPAAEETVPTQDDVEAKLTALQAEVERLTDELRAKTAEAELIKGELGEFSELFPGIVPEDIPTSVWESVKRGNSLAAAYAVHHRRQQLRAERVRSVNEANARRSSGGAGRGAGAEFFTPDEVRAMSQSEVRANYTRILDSMKKWN